VISRRLAETAFATAEPKPGTVLTPKASSCYLHQDAHSHRDEAFTSCAGNFRSQLKFVVGTSRDGSGAELGPALDQTGGELAKKLRVAVEASRASRVAPGRRPQAGTAADRHVLQVCRLQKRRG
jgi:hypothetical protein